MLIRRRCNLQNIEPSNEALWMVLIQFE